MFNVKEYKAILLAILAAVLYAISSPISKLLLKEISPTFMASFLYLGAGIGLAIVGFYYFIGRGYNKANLFYGINVCSISLCFVGARK